MELCRKGSTLLRGKHAPVMLLMDVQAIHAPRSKAV